MSNVIITNLSKLRDSESRLYSSDVGEIEGVNTNDAPVKYLVSLIDSKNMNVGKIIAVTTEEAGSSFDKFKDTLSEFSKCSGISLPTPTKVPAGQESFAKTISDIIGNIKKGDSVWIDTTGGFRNSSYLLMAVARILEYSGIKVEKAVYSNFEKYAIVDVTDTYHMFDLINAANSFTSFGNSDELFHFFKDCKDETIKNVIAAMNDFSEAVALCRTSGLDGILERLNDGLAQLGNTSDATESEILFRSISGVIKEKFSIRNNEKIDYTDVILWCVQNKMIQQAVTVYTEKCGEYLYNRYITASDDEWDRIRNNKQSYENPYYKLFYMGFMTMETTPLRQLLRRSAKDMELRNDIINSDNMGQFHKTSSSEKLTAEQKYDLKQLFKIKRIFYNNGVRRDFYDISADLEKNPQYMDFAKIKAKSFEGFLNTISNGEWFKTFYSDRPGMLPYENIRLNVIENLESAYNGQSDYTIKNIQLSRMQDILRDYLYIKTLLRNVVNHAGDNNDNETENKEIRDYFKKYGYNTDSAPSLSVVTEIIKNAVKRLKGEDLS